MEGAEGAGRMGLESDQRALFGRKKEEEKQRRKEKEKVWYFASLLDIHLTWFCRPSESLLRKRAGY